MFSKIMASITETSSPQSSQPNYKRLPKQIESLLNAPDPAATNSYCGHCRQTASQRCSRCQVATYCSSSCQKSCFSFHKGHCKKIKKRCDEINDLRENVFSDAVDGECGRTEAPELDKKVTTELATKMFKLADLVMEVGYRESDTLRRGTYYYQAALKYYLEPWQFLGKDDFFSLVPKIFMKGRFVEDVLLLLFIVLGGDDITIFEWCYTSGSPRIEYFKKECDDDDWDNNNVGDDVTLQTLSLLGKMRRLMEHRSKVEVDIANSNSHSSQVDKISDEIRLLVEAIKRNGYESYLIHWRDSIPLRPEHAPTLFKGSDMIELWMIFQDLLFETEGMNDVFNEFIPEE